MTDRVAPFLRQLYDMVVDPKCDAYICWSSNGKQFVMKDTEKLAKEVFPTHFRHGSFQSFMRQLHNYGFRGRQLDGGTYEYRHEGFVRGQPHLLSTIQRKAAVKQEPVHRSDIDEIRQENQLLRREVAEVKDSQREIRSILGKTLRVLEKLTPTVHVGEKRKTYVAEEPEPSLTQEIEAKRQCSFSFSLSASQEADLSRAADIFAAGSQTMLPLPATPSSQLLPLMGLSQPPQLVSMIEDPVGLTRENSLMPSSQQNLQSMLGDVADVSCSQHSG